METYIEATKLTDGSLVYAVVFYDGSMAAKINTLDEKAADHIAGVFRGHQFQPDVD